MWLGAFLVAVLGLALNVTLYLSGPNPFSVFGIVVCGACAVFNLAMAAVDR